MCREFVHVHNHTEYSLLDGANRIPDLVARAKDLGQSALAITDHGVMFGAMEFYFECKKQGVKPILGMEAYVAPNGRNNKSGREENQSYHLLLLAKDADGYRNLCKLHTVAALEGFYYKPRIDHEILRQHAKGLIGTSACLGSEVCQALLRGDDDGAERIAAMYRDLFDPDSYFIELQNHGLREQAEIESRLLRIAKNLRLPVLATNDAHYLCRESSQAHDVLLCVGTGALVSDTKRLKFETDEFFLKSAEEMGQLFQHVPEALENTLRVAEMCNVELGSSRARMPEPNLPEGMSSCEYLRHLAESGLRERVSQVDERAWERLNYELGVIESTGFEDYFLLVREFAQYAQSQGIAYGVRGSAAGSLVSYTVGITDVDPLQYDLTFERFLNPERISMPDIDMDFEDARRGEVIQWVTEQYGSDRVAQIVTFGTLGAKAAIKDAGRVLGYEPKETDRITKTIPNLPGISIERALESSDEFRHMVESEDRVRQLVEVAQSVEGMARHAGVHAAGVVIARDPLSDFIPLYRSAEGLPVTAYEMGILEKIGLLKMDFLGLSNLTVLARAVDNVRRAHAGGDPVEHPILDTPIQQIGLEDRKTFEMLGRGETVGVFQLESGGMRRSIMELKPGDVRELAAMVALYRPGPMSHITRFIDTKFGRATASYLDERMRPILEETYGVIVYQDQVLKLVQALAGFSLGKADLLRRAMSKKDKHAMDAMQSEFRSGCKAQGVADEVVEEVWELLLPFAGYAFNKAHAVCYALLAYQTAYLKANYPTEFMAALLEVYRDKEDRVTAFIEECRRQKIAVMPPDVNRSGLGFEIEAKAPPKFSGAIRFGLAAIKGVGEGIVEDILRSRDAEGPFTHLYEFCVRVRRGGLNRTSLEALIKAGALDGFGSNRNSLIAVIDGALMYADNVLRMREAGQDSLFGGPGESSSDDVLRPQIPEIEAPRRNEILAMEKEVMGIYVSDHPLRGLERSIRDAQSHSCSAASELEEGTRVVLCGVIAGLRTIITKQRGEKMATLNLEDFSGQVACTVFAATYKKFGKLIEKDKVVRIKGQVSVRQGRNGGDSSQEIRVDEIMPFEANPDMFEDDPTSEGTIIVKIRRAHKDQMWNLRQLLEAYPGSFRVILEVGLGSNAGSLELIHRVAYSPLLHKLLEHHYIEGSVELVERDTFASSSQSVETAFSA